MTTYHSTKHRQLCTHCGEDWGAHDTTTGRCPDVTEERVYLDTTFEAATEVAKEPPSLPPVREQLARSQQAVTMLQGQLQGTTAQLTARDDEISKLNRDLATAELDTRTAQAALEETQAGWRREIEKNEQLLTEARRRDGLEQELAEARAALADTLAKHASEDQGKVARQTNEITRLGEQLTSEKRLRKATEEALAKAKADAKVGRDTDAQTIRRLQGQRDRMGTTIAQLEAQRKNLGVAVAKILGHKVTATGNVELDVVCMALELANRRPSETQE